MQRPPWGYVVNCLSCTCLNWPYKHLWIYTTVLCKFYLHSLHCLRIFLVLVNEQSMNIILLRCRSTSRCLSKSSRCDECFVDVVVIHLGFVGKMSVAVQRAARLRDRDARSAVVEPSSLTGLHWRYPPAPGLAALAVSKRWTSDLVPGEPSVMSDCLALFTHSSPNSCRYQRQSSVQHISVFSKLYKNLSYTQWKQGIRLYGFRYSPEKPFKVI